MVKGKNHLRPSPRRSGIWHLSHGGFTARERPAFGAGILCLLAGHVP